jgi:hypothetical protein
LIHFDRNCELFIACAVAGSAHRDGAESVKPNSDPNIRLGWANTVDHIEADPTETGDETLSPGVAAVLLNGAVGAKIPSDVARRDREAARCSDKDMRQIAGDASLARENLDGRRSFLRFVVIVGQFLVQPVHEGVKVTENVVAVRGTGLAGKLTDAFISLRQ